MTAPSEYLSRQSCFADALATAGYDGALVVSRGGSTFDRYANVLYLSGHYQSYSYLPDEPGLFSGRAHTALVVAGERAALCVSVPEVDGARLAVDDVRVSEHFESTVAGALRDLGLAAARVALVGADVLPLTIWRSLRALVPDIAFEDADELLAALRRIKSPAEQAMIRRAVLAHRQGMSALLDVVAPGRRESDLVGVFAQAVMREGAGIYFTSLSSGDATGRWASAATPGFGTRPLCAGDLLRCDTGIVVDGYLSDFGRTVVVGEPSDDQKRLIEVLHRGLDAAIAAVRPGVAARDVAAAGEARLRSLGALAEDDGSGRIHSSFPVHWGHGLGLGWERPWLTGSETVAIEEGMYLAVERALTLPGTGTAAAEQTMLVGPNGAEVLTAGPSDFWG